MKQTIYCPTCEKETILDSKNTFRPFCSERCRLIDLGQWIEESYTISDPSYPDEDNIIEQNLSLKH